MPSAPDAAALFHEGLELVQQGKTPQGLERWEECVRRFPGFPEPYGHLGWHYLQTGSVDRAIPLYRKLIELQPELAEAHLCLGMALCRVGRVDEAHVEYQRARELGGEGSDRRKDWDRQWRENLKRSGHNHYRSAQRLRDWQARNPLARKAGTAVKALAFAAGHLGFLLYEPLARRKVLPEFCTRHPRRFSLPRFRRLVAGKVEGKLHWGMAYTRTVEAAIHSEAIGLKPGTSVIDVGTGANPLPLYWALRGMKVVCTDPDDFVYQLEPIAKKLGLESALHEGRLEFRQADGCSLPYPDNSFDYWTSVSVVEHIPGDGDSAVMREAARVLKPGGIAVVTTESGPSTHDRWYRVEEYFGKQYVEQIDDCTREVLGFGDAAGSYDEWNSEGKQASFALIRDYDRNMLMERLVKPSGMELVEMGFLDSRFRTDYRGIVDGHFRPLLGSLLIFMSPLACYATYRRLPTDTDRALTPSATAYVILRKPGN